MKDLRVEILMSLESGSRSLDQITEGEEAARASAIDELVGGGYCTNVDGVLTLTDKGEGAVARIKEHGGAFGLADALQVLANRN